jgi:hypothetical protein
MKTSTYERHLEWAGLKAFIDPEGGFSKNRPSYYDLGNMTRQIELGEGEGQSKSARMIEILEQGEEGPCIMWTAKVDKDGNPSVKRVSKWKRQTPYITEVRHDEGKMRYVCLFANSTSMFISLTIYLIK